MLNKIGLVGLTLGLGLTGGCASNNAPLLQNRSDSTTVQYQQRAGRSETGNTDFSTSAATTLPAAQLAVKATETMTRSAAAAGTDDKDYRVGPEDLLEIRVFGVDDLSRTVRVSSRGFISLPLVGEVKAAGLTSVELETRLAELFGKDYLQNPHIGVFVKEYTGRRVTVDGAVNKPGVYPLNGRTTLLQAIALAGGANDRYASNDVTLYRHQPSGEKLTLEVDISNIQNDIKSDPLIQNDDIIRVHKNVILFFIDYYVLGIGRSFVPSYY